MNKNILCSILLSVILTGCSVQYHLEINEDFSVNETINATEDNSFFQMYEHTAKRDVIDFIFKPYLEEINISLYNYGIIDDNQKGGMSVRRQYS
jgi:hypothetical protein